MRNCPECNGMRRVFHRAYLMTGDVRDWPVRCPACGGTGQVPDEEEQGEPELVNPWQELGGEAGGA